MKLFYGWFALALLSRGAVGEPRPDFGIETNIAASAQVSTVVGQATVNFDRIDLKTITLTTHYTRLVNLEAAMTKIAKDITKAGLDLTTALDALVPNSTSAQDRFDAVLANIVTLQTLLETGLQTQTDAIVTMVGSYITDMLTDATDQLLSTLTNLHTQIEQIKQGVASAVLGFGSSTIPSTYLRRYVSPRTIFELQRSLHDLKADLPLVTFIIELVLGHLSTADTFLADLMNRVPIKVTDSLMHYDSLKQEVLLTYPDIVLSIVKPTEKTYKQQISELAGIKNELEAMSMYATDLQPAMDKFASLFSNANFGTLFNGVEVIFTNYLADVVKLDDHLEVFYDQKLCAPVQAVLQVLIASGPWADYCFSKYSPRLYELVAINTNQLLLCYQLEADRLVVLAELVSMLVMHIIFDIEDLSDHLLECFNRIEDAADCYANIGPYYIELSDNLELKMADLTILLTDEMEASYNRLAACIAAGKCGFVASAEQIVRDVQACDLEGPLA